jgi:hypothetical protein
LEAGFEGGFVLNDDVPLPGSADFFEGVVVDFAVSIDGGDDVVRGGLEAVSLFHDELEGIGEAAVAAGEEAESADVAVDGAAAEVEVGGENGGAAEAEEGVFDGGALRDSRASVRALDLETPSSGYQWRPERARASEYVADLERIGRQALRRPEWRGRLKLFEIYFLQGTEYRRAISLVGVAEGTFDYWFAEVKRAVGRECTRTGLFLPSRYFQLQRNGSRPSGSTLPARADA